MHSGLAAGAAFYTAVGVAALVRPGAVPAAFGGTASTASSRTEIRAVYGGLPLAMAGIVLAESRSRGALSARRGTEAVALLTAAMAVGRLVGAAVEGEADGVTRLFVALEAATAVALAVGARSDG
jgi:hypothetical protein